ncbi:hypothetical protein BJF84_17205 [Rhodococcus sp. CUA-806]|nr:hypothetical protein BJF84_17205 [Rhodococcus sp. CUA-806]
MSAEAGYLGIGSQFSVLILFLIADDEATAGIRLCYVLVFAPAFMLVQGLQPLVLKKVADLNKSKRSSIQITNLLLKWQILIVAIIFFCGFAAAVVNLVFTGSPLSGAIEYIVPVGVAVVGSQLFDATMLEMRFRVKPSLIHQARLWMVVMETSAMAASALMWQSTGVLGAMVVGGISKIAFSIYATLVAMRSRNRRIGYIRNDDNIGVF